MDKKWKHLHSEYDEKDYRIFKIRRDRLLSPRTNKEVNVTVLEAADAVNVVAITKDQQLVLAKQYRFGTGEYTLEIPGGFVDDKEEQSFAGKRELEEETGYTGGDWSYLGSVPSNPAFMDNHIHHWIALGVEPNGQINLDEEEDVSLELMPIAEIVPSILSAKITHPHTISALFFYLNQSAFKTTL